MAATAQDPSAPLRGGDKQKDEDREEDRECLANIRHQTIFKEHCPLHE